MAHGGGYGENRRAWRAQEKLIAGDQKKSFAAMPCFALT
jgi:hypothetical protein